MTRRANKAIEMFNGEVDEYNRKVEADNETIEAFMRKARRRTWQLYTAAVLLAVAMSMLGGLFVWGIQHGQAQVTVQASIAAVALLGTFVVRRYWPR